MYLWHKKSLQRNHAASILKVAKGGNVCGRMQFKWSSTLIVTVWKHLANVTCMCSLSKYDVSVESEGQNAGGKSATLTSAKSNTLLYHERGRFLSGSPSPNKNSSWLCVFHFVILSANKDLLHINNLVTHCTHTHTHSITNTVLYQRHLLSPARVRSSRLIFHDALSLLRQVWKWMCTSLRAPRVIIK